jgi:hypothetical protein
LQNLFDLANEAFEGKVATEASTRNTLTKVQNSISKLLAAAGSSTASKDASEDVLVDSTEVVPEAAEIDATQVEATEIADEDDLDVDLTMDTKFTAAPDAEGTIFGDYEDEDEESDGTIKGDELPVRIKTEKGVVNEDGSLLESLLNEDSTID